MAQRERTGLWASLAGSALGLFGTMYLFVMWWQPMMQAEYAAGRPDEATIVAWFIPMLSDLGLIAGVLYAVAAYGFATQTRWGWHLAVLANVLALQGSFFTMIPAASRGLPPVFGWIFVPNVALFFLLVSYVGRVPWRTTALAFTAGLAFVLCFMNGVASTNRIMVIGHPLFVVAQRMNFVASATLGVFIAALLFGQKWARPVGLAGALLGVVGGLPVAGMNMWLTKKFSMFAPAPLLCLVLLGVLLAPALGTGHRTNPTAPTNEGSGSDAELHDPNS